MNIFLAGGYSRPKTLQQIKTYLPNGEESSINFEKMKVYLAGITAGNFQNVWKENVENFGELVKIFDQMKTYISAPHSNWMKDALEASAGEQIEFYKPYILESFFYVEDWMKPYIQNWWNFLLDSGAFTFMQNAGSGASINWKDYVKKYADYINELNIDLFFELDIDSIIGLKEVERLRDYLEKLTGKKSVPVWHIARGKQKWIEICKNYEFVAIGGIVSKEIKPADFKVFHYLLQIAKDHGTKVHGLGFTNTEKLHVYKFDSVDSTAWIYGNRGGFLYRFNGRNLEKFYLPEGKRLKSKEAAIHNFNEWLKFQKYAEKNL